jgi:hypothetical protein
MSRYVFRGHSYEKLARSIDVSATSRELTYKKKSLVDQQNHIIRSRETARLLDLDFSPLPDNRLIYRGCPVLPKPSSLRSRRTIQLGGFIRSRMTAELIGVEPSPSPSLTVRPGGFLRSRSLATLLGVDASPFVRKRIYRGVQY